jgi:hypothetical protein
LPTLPEYLSSPTVFNGVHVARSLVFCVVFCKMLFVLLSFFFWPLYCLSFFDLRLLITSLVSSKLFLQNMDFKLPLFSGILSQVLKLYYVWGFVCLFWSNKYPHIFWIPIFLNTEICRKESCRHFKISNYLKISCHLLLNDENLMEGI